MGNMEFTDDGMDAPAPTNERLMCCNKARGSIVQEALIDHEELRKQLRLVAPLGTDLAQFAILSIRPTIDPTNTSTPTLDDLISPENLAEVLDVSIVWRHEPEYALKTINFYEEHSQYVQRNVETYNSFTRALSVEELTSILNRLGNDQLFALARFAMEELIKLAGQNKEEQGMEKLTTRRLRGDARTMLVRTVISNPQNAGLLYEIAGVVAASGKSRLDTAFIPINATSAEPVHNVVHYMEHPDAFYYEPSAIITWQKIVELSGGIRQKIHRITEVPRFLFEKAIAEMSPKLRLIHLEHMRHEALENALTEIIFKERAFHLIPIDTNGELDALRESVIDKINDAFNRLLRLSPDDVKMYNEFDKTDRQEHAFPIDAASNRIRMPNVTNRNFNVPIFPLQDGNIQYEQDARPSDNAYLWN